ncbi:MAG TPA: GxxExxY protein [Chthoniobacterales bacterium]|jgi:GxxExxY protein|nr:GxxExxY protein [Chthoniobacterales bacterium]
MSTRRESDKNVKFQTANGWSKVVIGAAIEVHSLKGAGLIDSIYERCMLREFELRNVPVLSQLDDKIEYKGLVFSTPLTLDLYVDDCLLVELKAVQAVLPIHKAQLRSYMKLLNAPLGLLINFHELSLKNGIHRLMLPRSSGNDNAQKD